MDILKFLNQYEGTALTDIPWEEFPDVLKATCWIFINRWFQDMSMDDLRELSGFDDMSLEDLLKQAEIPKSGIICKGAKIHLCDVSLDQPDGEVFCFSITVPRDWLDALESLARTVIASPQSTPEEMIETAIFTQVQERLSTRNISNNKTEGEE